MWAHMTVNELPSSAWGRRREDTDCTRDWLSGPRELEREEKFQGPDDPDILISLDDLAIISEDQGQFGKAEEMFRQVMNGSEKAGTEPSKQHLQCPQPG